MHKAELLNLEVEKAIASKRRRNAPLGNAKSLPAKKPKKP